MSENGVDWGGGIGENWGHWWRGDTGGENSLCLK